MRVCTKWYDKVVEGDMLYPDPLWNKTERPPSQLHSPTEVLFTKPEQSQSGVLFVVRTKNGMVRELDAGWFLPPQTEHEAAK